MALSVLFSILNLILIVSGWIVPSFVGPALKTALLSVAELLSPSLNRAGHVDLALDEYKQGSVAVALVDEDIAGVQFSKGHNAGEYTALVIIEFSTKDRIAKGFVVD